MTEHLTLEQRALLASMATVIEGVRAGLPHELAADRARVPRVRLGAWVQLGHDGAEPFSSFVVELRAVRGEARFEVLENLRALAAVDARAAETYLQQLERVQGLAETPHGRAAKRPSAWPISDEETQQAAELALVRVNDCELGAEALRALLTAPAEQQPERSEIKAITVATFEPRRRARR